MWNIDNYGNFQIYMIGHMIFVTTVDYQNISYQSYHYQRLEICVVN